MIAIWLVRFGISTSALLSTSNAIIKLGAGNDTLALTAGSSAGYVYAEAGDDTIYVASALTASDGTHFRYQMQ